MTDAFPMRCRATMESPLLQYLREVVEVVEAGGGGRRTYGGGWLQGCANVSKMLCCPPPAHTTRAAGRLPHPPPHPPTPLSCSTPPTLQPAALSSPPPTHTHPAPHPTLSHTGMLSRRAPHALGVLNGGRQDLVRGVAVRGARRALGQNGDQAACDEALPRRRLAAARPRQAVCGWPRRQCRGARGGGAMRAAGLSAGMWGKRGIGVHVRQPIPA